METAQRMRTQEGKLLPYEYEKRIVDAITGLSVLRKFFSSVDEVHFEAGEQDGVAWILGQVIKELEETALNCENVRRA